MKFYLYNKPNKNQYLGQIQYISELSGIISQLTTRKEQIQKQYNDAKTEFESIQNSKNQQIRKLQDQKHEKEQLIHYSDEQHKSLNDQIQQIHQKIQFQPLTDQEKTQLETKISELEKTIEEYQKFIDECNQKIQKELEQLDPLKNSLIQKEQDFNSIKNQIESKQKQENQNQLDFIQKWKNISTQIPYVQCDIQGKSHGFNQNTQAWDLLLDDWRGKTLYLLTNSKRTIKGSLNPIPQGYTSVTPPDSQKQYVWKDDTWFFDQEKYVKQTIKYYEDAIQSKIDHTAQLRGYDNGYTCASYADDKNPRYASDARIFKDWRSDVWGYVNDLLNKYKAGQLEKQPTLQEILDALPKIQWKDL